MNEYLSFRKIFILKSGKMNFKDIKISITSDIVFVNYNKTNINVNINNDNYITEGLYISKILNSHKNEIISYVSGKSINSSNSYLITVNSENEKKINIKYIYYYLKFYKDYIISNFYKGNIIKYLSVLALNEMIIVLPPIETQNSIVKELDFIYEEANVFLKKQIEENKEYATKFLVSYI